MPVPWRRGIYDKVDYVVVERDGVEEVQRLGDPEVEATTTTTSEPLRASYARRQAPTSAAGDDIDDDDDDHNHSLSMTLRTTSTTGAVSSAPSAFLITMTLGDNASSSTSAGALADNDPTETVIVALPPPPRPHHGDRDGKISQTTEHLLIAAGSIGATIIIVMVVLALYTMRKRGLSFSDIFQRSKNQAYRARPPPPPKYGFDNKRSFDDEYSYTKKSSIPPPQLAAISTRSNSFSMRAPLQKIGRSDSFTQRGLSRNDSVNKSFFDDSLSHGGSHHRNDSATPSSPVLPVQGRRRSASSRNTRSMDSQETLHYNETQAERALPPAPPTFKQFLSNRPTMSQRPAFGGGGGGMPSRFSWTNSNAPQTPHDPARDTVAQPLGRDSFMTSRSSVPRFRTVDSWVNQQSNRVQEQRLKQQFRMTRSSTSSIGDEADKVPEIPTALQRKPSGLAGKNIKHSRHDTATTVQTAAVFRAHPGTEVRFSTRSMVPSEVLDMGRKNAAL